MTVIKTITWMFISIDVHFELQILDFWHYAILVLEMLTSQDVLSPIPFF